MMKSLSAALSHQGSRAQSEAQLQFESQHAFELLLEEMLMEVKVGSGKKEERQKKQGTKKSHPLVGRKFGTRDWDKKLVFSNLKRRAS